jgi:hypothetical protein
VHIYTFASLRVLAIPAGRYSIQLRWRRASGTATFKSDTNDLFTISVDEGVRASNPVL